MNREKPPIPERERPSTDDVKAALGETSIIHCDQNLDPIEIPRAHWFRKGEVPVEEPQVNHNANIAVHDPDVAYEGEW